MKYRPGHHTVAKNFSSKNVFMSFYQKKTVFWSGAYYTEKVFLSKKVFFFSFGMRGVLYGKKVKRFLSKKVFFTPKVFFQPPYTENENTFLFFCVP